MSALDGLVETIDAQLAERRAEMERLQEARNILTDTPKAASDNVRAIGSGKRRRTRAKPGERMEQMIEVLRARPGIKVGEIGPAIGAEATYGYKAINRLKNESKVVREGDGWRLVEEVAQTA